MDGESGGFANDLTPTHTANRLGGTAAMPYERDSLARADGCSGVLQYATGNFITNSDDRESLQNMYSQQSPPASLTSETVYRRAGQSSLRNEALAQAPIACGTFDHLFEQVLTTFRMLTGREPAAREIPEALTQ